MAAAAIAGFVVCSVLLAIVIALIAYNCYIWRRRRSEARRKSAKLVRQPSPRWKAYQEANGIGGTGGIGGIGGTGTRKPRRGQENLGYAHSAGSVDVKGLGPPPTASVDEVNLSDDDGEEEAQEESFPMKMYRQEVSPDFYERNYRDASPNLNGVKIYPNTQDRSFDDTEIQLRPGKLESSTQNNISQLNAHNNNDETTINHQRYYMNSTHGHPPYYGSTVETKVRSNDLKPPRPNINRNSGFAVLTPGENHAVPKTVSVTGMGALECPGQDFGPTSPHRGGLRYSAY